MSKKQVILVLGHEDAEVVERALSNHGRDANIRFQMSAGSLSEKENRWLLNERMRSANVGKVIQEELADKSEQLIASSEQSAETMLEAGINYFIKHDYAKLRELLEETYHVV